MSPHPQPSFSAWHAEVIEKAAGLLATVTAAPPTFLPHESIIALAEMEYAAVLIDDAMKVITTNLFQDDEGAA